MATSTVWLQTFWKRTAEGLEQVEGEIAEYSFFGLTCSLKQAKQTKNVLDFKFDCSLSSSVTVHCLKHFVRSAVYFIMC